MTVKNTLHMNGGDDDTSYANNSGLQKVVISKTLPVLDETIDEMLRNDNFDIPKCFKIVDLGCSSGPNALWAISHIKNRIEEISRKNSDQVPQFEVFLNDLQDNDFNTLFKLLPSSRNSFVYGVPGSFYGRLLPNRTLHLAYSSYSLHWLSKIPEGLENSTKENIYLTIGSSSDVIEAYKKQYQRDFSSFLSMRGEEMLPGGRMILAFIGRNVEDPSIKDDCGYVTLIAESLQDMVAEELIKLEDLYSFNSIHYAPHKREVETAVKTEGSFTLDKLNVLHVRWDATEDTDYAQQDPVFDKYMSAKLVSDCMRAVLTPMLASHFGSSIIDDLFGRYAKKMAEHLSTEESIYYTIVVSLTRK